MSQEKQNKTATQTPTIELRSEDSELFIEERSAFTDEPDKGSRTIVGYAAKFGCWSSPIGGWFRERISRDAFSETDVDDVIVCFNHDVNSILARTSSETLRISTDKVGLRFEFEAPHTTLGDDILELVRRGDVSKCSFKFSVDADSWSYATRENGQEYDERTIEHIAKLYDVSLVVYPAYRDTEASVRELEERKAKWLEEQGATTEKNGKGCVNSVVTLDTSSRDRLVAQMGLKVGRQSQDNP